MAEFSDVIDCYPPAVLNVGCPRCMAGRGKRCWANFPPGGKINGQRHLPHDSRMRVAGVRWPAPVKPVEPCGTGWV